MTREEIQLLLKDLSARLMYGVMCQVDDGAAGLNDGKLVEIDISKELVRFEVDYYWNAYIDDVKPYLRPMSSMTEEEYKSVSWEGCSHTYNYSSKSGFQFVEIKTFTLNILDWLNIHHFDYRNLIEKGLAIAVDENNNPYDI